MAIATSESNEVLLFRRQSDGRFEEAPYRVIGRSPSKLDYPHDVSFAVHGSAELLAVAQRAGVIAIYERQIGDSDYGRDPIFELGGPCTGLEHSDGVMFVPPNDDHVAVCNLTTATISFFRKTPHSPVRFEETPEFELRHPSIFGPDGLAFSDCGRWLAVANHGKHTVAIFKRSKGGGFGGNLRFGPEPVTIIEDPRLRYPHSVAFTPRKHLVVTNAGANYFTVYAPKRRWNGMQWHPEPVAQILVHDDKAFQEINMVEKMEGGPKGVAVCNNSFAICSPQIGVKFYAFHES